MCNVCGKVFQKIYACYFCEKRFQNESNLSEHCKTYTLLRRNIFKCNVCGKVFTKSMDATVHCKTPTISKTNIFKCNVCGKVFTCVLLLRIIFLNAMFVGKYLRKSTI